MDIVRATLRKGQVTQMKNKIALLIAALVMFLMIGVICAMSVGAAGGRVSMGELDLTFGGNADLRNTIELPLSEVSNLKLEYGSKDIVVLPADGDKIIIKEYLYSDREKAKATVTMLEDGEVIVTGGRVTSFVFFGFGLLRGGERIEVSIPDRALKNLFIGTGSGNIRGNHDCVAEDGRMIAQSGSGNIKWKNISSKELLFQAGSGNVHVSDVTGMVEIQTGSGNITGEAICGSLNADAGSGNITLEEFVGSGELSANSGNINVDASTINDDLALETGSGNIHLGLPTNLEFHLQVNTGSGSIRTNFDDALSYNQNGNSAEGDVGDAPTLTIHAKTGSGNVKIVK